LPQVRIASFPFQTRNMIVFFFLHGQRGSFSRRI
jgi:hypothetical protein